jgi:diguanylate cyclase (GGDEF)-like protein/PAS domain S-box-containing protein
VLGYPPEDLYGNSPWGLSLLDPRDHDIAVGAMRAEIGSQVDMTVRLLAKDGQVVWTQHRCAKHLRDDGSIVLVGAACDITEQHELAERYRLLAENASDVVAMSNAAGIVEWISSSVERLLGWTPEQIVGRPFTELIHPDDLPAILAGQRTLALGAPSNFEARVRQADGEYRWVTSHVQPIAGPDGVIVRRVAGLRDSQSEHEARKMAAASEERYRQLAENASDVVYRTGTDGLVQWISPTVTTTLGWDPDVLLGTSILELMHPDDVPGIADVRARVLAGESVDNPEGGFISRFRSANGQYVWMSVRTTPIHDDRGGPCGAINGMRNVDDLVHQQETATREAAHRKAVLESLLDPHVLLQAVRDEAGLIVDFIYAEANDAACEYNQTPRDELVGMRLLTLLPGQAGSGMLAMYADAVESGEPLIVNDYAYPHEVMQEDRRFDIRAIRVGDALSFTWRDVTDRHDAAQAIAASEEKYRLLAENSSDVVLHSRRGTIVWISPSVTEALGGTPSGWVGLDLADVIHPDDVDAYLAWSAEVDAGDPRVRRVRIRAVDGSCHWIEAHARTYVGPDGQPDGQISSFRLADDVVNAHSELEHRATFDDLTGALKRDPALERLNEISHHPRSPGVETGILFMDVDDFKFVNDTWGHAVGDTLLKAIADRVRATVRAGDTVARMGGDEFLIALQGMHDLEETAAVAEKIRAACAEPVRSGAGPVMTTVSIGVTLADPVESGDELIARADKAMYAAKRAGRDRVVAVPLRSGRHADSTEVSS